MDAIGNGQHVERLSNENIEAQDQQYKVSFLISCCLIFIFFQPLHPQKTAKKKETKKPQKRWEKQKSTIPNMLLPRLA